MVKVITHFGTCDASAAVALPGRRVIVANDEDARLAVYDAFESGAARSVTDFTEELKIPAGDEADLEDATLLDDRVFWITSHGTNKKGKPQPSRRRFFATTVPNANGKMSLAGKPYTGLVGDMPKILSKVADRSPDQGGMNIEGLTSSADKEALLIGFRGPLVNRNGRDCAVVLPLLNPNKLIEGKADKARFGDLIFLDLNGMGVRAMSHSESAGGYLILAGSMADRGKFGLYRWDGRSPKAEQLARLNDVLKAAGIDPEDASPEAVIVHQDSKHVQVLLDEGDRRSAQDVKCKDLPEKSRFFRSLLFEHLV
jgi:hypothetical protein